MKTQILHAHGSNGPLTASEQEVIDLLHAREDTRPWSEQAGLAVIEIDREKFLNWDRTANMEPAIQSLEASAERWFHEHTWRSRQRSCAVRRIALRLAMGVWKFDDQRTLNCLLALAECLYLSLIHI